ncbi:MAG: thioredoxin family protein [Dehalococcoidia bacterium]
MIPLRDQEYLRDRFARELTGAVRVDYFTQRQLPIFIPGREECPYCEDAQTMLKELAALSEKIALSVHEFSESLAEAARLHVDKVPGTVIRGAINRPVRFFGFAAGQQFPAFVEGIVDASRGKASLSTETVRQLRKLQKTVALQVFVTPECPHCPEMTRLAHSMALESARVGVDVVEISEFPRLAGRYRVQAVPTMIVEERVVLVGAMSESDLVNSIVDYARGKTLAGPAGPVGASTPLGQPAQPAQQRRGSGLILP